jgi:hypothetical protein
MAEVLPLLGVVGAFCIGKVLAPLLGVTRAELLPAVLFAGGTAEAPAVLLPPFTDVLADADADVSGTGVPSRVLPAPVPGVIKSSAEGEAERERFPLPLDLDISPQEKDLRMAREIPLRIVSTPLILSGVGPGCACFAVIGRASRTMYSDSSFQSRKCRGGFTIRFAFTFAVASKASAMSFSK